MTERTWSGHQKSIFNWFAKKDIFPDAEFKPTATLTNLLVRARAGTGKTTTILEAINYAPEEKILLAAFNKRIAEELKTKLKNPRASAKTLHSVGFSFVMNNWKGCRLDDERGERLAEMACGSGTPKPILGLVQRLAAIGKNAAPFPTDDLLVDLAYEFDLEPDEYLQDEGWSVDRVAMLAKKAMDLALKDDGTMDFDDMVYVPVRNGWVRPRFDLVVIDEAQDMNASQLLLAIKVCKKGGRIVVVGDDRQAIYGFRGADSGAIDRLKGELVAMELPLTITYRCPKRVVEQAQALVPDYTAAPTAPEGIFREENYEKMVEAAQPGDFVLSRKNAPLAKVCLRFIRMGKSAMVEGKDIGAGLKNVLNNLKAKSIPDFMERLTKWEAKQEVRLKKTGKKSAEKKIEYIHDQAETLRALAEGAKSLAEVEGRIDRMFMTAGSDRLNYIVCSSVHKAKGSERKRVFGLMETLYPGGRRDVVEEQNIHYVMITRAMQEFVGVVGIN